MGIDGGTRTRRFYLRLKDCTAARYSVTPTARPRPLETENGSADLAQRSRSGGLLGGGSDGRRRRRRAGRGDGGAGIRRIGIVAHLLESRAD